jgi:hypothetical protein
MSSASFLGHPTACWRPGKPEGRIYFRSGRQTVTPVAVASVPGAKHPALATNSRGETLVVWTEGTGWQRGGDLAWQVFDPKGQPTAEHVAVSPAFQSGATPPRLPRPTASL